MEKRGGVLGECQSVHPLGGNTMEVLKKQNIEDPSDPAIPHLDGDPEETKI